MQMTLNQHVLDNTVHHAASQVPVAFNGREIPLAQAPMDTEVVVTRVEVDREDRLHRLAALGLLPGACLRLLQNRGAYLAQVDRAQIAFDSSVAKAIFCRVESLRA